MNIKEVATLTGINTHTLRTWQKYFNIEVPRNPTGYREYSEEIIKKLLAIKALREADNGINTIKNQLGIESININVVKPENIVNPANNENILSTLELMNQNINIKLEKLEAVTELAEKYSRATFEIGKLQAEKTAIEEKLLLITDGNNKDITGLKNEVDKLKQENDKIRFENETLKNALEAEKKTPWHKRIFR